MTSWRSASSATAEAPRIHWENAWATGKTCSPTALRRANFPASLLASTTSSRRAASIAAARRRVVASRAQQTASSASAAATPRHRCSAAAAALVPWRVTSRPRRSELADASLRPRSTAGLGPGGGGGSVGWDGGARRSEARHAASARRRLAHSAASTRRRSAGTRRELRSRLAASALLEPALRRLQVAGARYGCTTICSASASAGTAAAARRRRRPQRRAAGRARAAGGAARVSPRQLPTWS